MLRLILLLALGWLLYWALAERNLYLECVARYGIDFCNIILDR